MTDTEEKDPFEKAKTHICGLPGFSEYFDYIRARKGHQPPTNDFLYAVSKYITSLTEERDELKRSTAFSRKAAADAVRKIRSLKSQLSNREKEIEELKEVLKKLSQVHIESIEPNYLCDNCATWTSGLLKAIEETEKLALASLNKEREE